MIFDIRTTPLARKTLENITGIPHYIWLENLYKESDFGSPDDFVEDIIRQYAHGNLPASYYDFDFVYSHITTSANGCKSLRTHGILDLKSTYACEDSELRQFLDEHNIYINLETAQLYCENKEFNISFGPCPNNHDSYEYKCWSVGRKFYYDYCTCGFLSVWTCSPYSGLVHQRPEILLDIDELLDLDLSHEWTVTHKPYEVVAKVSGKDIIYFGDKNHSDQETVMACIMKAYFTAFSGNYEEILLIKNGIQIPSENILEIKPLSFWD